MAQRGIMFDNQQRAARKRYQAQKRVTDAEKRIKVAEHNLEIFHREGAPQASITHWERELGKAQRALVRAKEAAHGPAAASVRAMGAAPPQREDDVMVYHPDGKGGFVKELVSAEEGRRIMQEDNQLADRRRVEREEQIAAQDQELAYERKARKAREEGEERQRQAGEVQDLLRELEAESATTYRLEDQLYGSLHGGPYPENYPDEFKSFLRRAEEHKYQDGPGDLEARIASNRQYNAMLEQRIADLPPVDPNAPATPTVQYDGKHYAVYVAGRPVGRFNEDWQAEAHVAELMGRAPKASTDAVERARRAMAAASKPTPRRGGRRGRYKTRPDGSVEYIPPEIVVEGNGER